MWKLLKIRSNTQKVAAAGGDLVYILRHLVTQKKNMCMRSPSTGSQAWEGDIYIYIYTTGVFLLLLTKSDSLFLFRQVDSCIWVRGRNGDCERIQAPRSTKPRLKFPWKCWCGFSCTEICTRIGFMHAERIYEFEHLDLTIPPIICSASGGADPAPFSTYNIKR